MAATSHARRDSMSDSMSSTATRHVEAKADEIPLHMDSIQGSMDQLNKDVERLGDILNTIDTRLVNLLVRHVGSANDPTAFKNSGEAMDATIPDGTLPRLRYSLNLADMQVNSTAAEYLHRISCRLDQLERI